MVLGLFGLCSSLTLSPYDMGACLSDTTDAEGEVSLYHFHLHRAVGRGAFGKVSVYYS